MKTKIKKWYSVNYPTDEMIEDMNEKVTFGHLLGALNNYENVYRYIFKNGSGDSIIRERVFSKLAEILNIKYEVIYKKWLECKEF